MAIQTVALTRAEEAANDLDRIIGAIGTTSFGRQDFIDLLMSILPIDKADKADKLFDELIEMCKEAESIRANAELPAQGDMPPLSLALEKDELDGNALLCLYAYHPSYKTCQDPMDTALALTVSGARLSVCAQCMYQ